MGEECPRLLFLGDLLQHPLAPQFLHETGYFPERSGMIDQSCACQPIHSFYVALWVLYQPRAVVWTGLPQLAYPLVLGCRKLFVWQPGQPHHHLLLLHREVRDNRNRYYT
jgi:hypothetical protein